MPLILGSLQDGLTRDLKRELKLINSYIGCLVETLWGWFSILDGLLSLTDSKLFRSNTILDTRLCMLYRKSCLRFLPHKRLISRQSQCLRFLFGSNRWVLIFFLSYHICSVFLTTSYDFIAIIMILRLIQIWDQITTSNTQSLPLLYMDTWVEILVLATFCLGSYWELACGWLQLVLRTVKLLFKGQHFELVFEKLVFSDFIVTLHCQSSYFMDQSVLLRRQLLLFKR